MPLKTNKLGTAGFTLIELMVAIALMMVLLTLVVANFTGTAPKQAVAVAHETLVSDIRKMQSFALDSRDTPNGAPASSYQVAFDLSSAASPAQYLLIGYDNATPPNEILLTTENLPPNIGISSIAVSHAGGAPLVITSGQLTIRYVLPYARMLVTYTASGGVTNQTDDAVTVNVSNSNGSVTTAVTANAVTGGVQ